MRWAATAFALLLAATPAATVDDGPAVDLARYMGTWHEIAHLANFPQRGCTDTEVHYRISKNGGFELLNTRWKGAKYKPYHGWATPSKPGSTAKFRVKFFAFIGADYWIVDLDTDYRWAAVGNAKRDQFWVISRASTMDEKTYDGILARASALGYDLAKLERTVTTGKTSQGFQK